MPLSDFVGEVVQVVFEVSTASGTMSGEVMLDDVALSGDCAAACVDTCADPDSCTQEQCVDGYCQSEPISGCCSQDVDCEDGDPCTVNECKPGVGCSMSAVPECLLGACLSSVMHAELPTDWVVVLGIDLVFVHSVDAPLDSAGHWKALAGSSSVGESTSLQLPSFMPVSNQMSLRFVLRQSVGSQCETGRLVVVLNESVELAVPCGYHDWRPVTVNLSLNLHTMNQVAVRFDAHGEGGSVELDDIRLVGHCQPVGCAADDDCPVDTACSISFCGSDYTCQSVWADDCCLTDSDCSSQGGVCGQSNCVNGKCSTVMSGGCDDNACMYESLDNGLPTGWSTESAYTALSSAVSEWTHTTTETYLGAGAIRGQLAWPVDASGVGVLSTDIVLPAILVGGGATMLVFQLKHTAVNADCLTGAVEVWMKGQLVAMDCGSNA